WGPDNICRMTQKDMVRRSHGKFIVVGDLTFATIRDACDHFGLPPNVVNWRIRSGWGIERAFCTPLQKNAKKPFFYMGEEFESQSACARALAARHGRHVERVRDYLKRKLPVEKWPPIS